MADHDGGAIEAVSKVGGPQAEPKMDLADMTADASAEAIAAGNLSSVMESAMADITTMPGATTDQLAFKDEIAGELGGDVMREKTGMVSDPGAADGTADDGDKMDALMSRYEKLYTDMTVYQVAWSIARRVQQDTAQLLRGQ